MTWASIQEHEYGVALTDGYLAPDVAEQALANRVFSRTRGLRSTCKPERFPNLAQAWVIGSPGWLTSAPEPLRSIAEGETRLDYRVLVRRFQLDADRMPYAVNGSAAAYAGGLRPQKIHRSRAKFRENARLILGLLNDYLMDAPDQPLRLFDDLRLACAYAGDPSNRDDPLVARIQ